MKHKRMLTIRKAREKDKDEVWGIIQSVIAKGDSYVFSPKSPKKEMLDHWFAAEKETFVAVAEGRIVGTFYLKENQPDLGSHICNAGFMVSEKAQGLGVGKKMAEFALQEAGRMEFEAMQFNFVVKSNEIAVKLWLKLGFAIIGEIPDAFQHQEKGLTNALIMYRKL